MSSPFLQSASTGLVVAVVGFFSSFPIVLQGLAAMGATPAQAATGLMAAAISMGATGIGLSLWRREPVSVAWSTPGAALLAVSAMPPGGFAEAIGAFVLAGVLTVIAGLWRPLGRMAAAVPAPLAQAMLAGVLVSLCIAPFRAMAEAPATALPVILTWAVVARINRLFAVPAAALAALAVTLHHTGLVLPAPDRIIAAPSAILPVFTPAAAIGIALPLFIVTMATQNVPGIAILRSFGYTPPPGPLLTGVGAASVLTAPFGAPATCLAAITAALCCGADAGPDPARRYHTAVVAGVVYCLFGLFAGAIIALATAAPPLLVPTLAGVALLGVFANAAAAALGETGMRDAAAVTFLVTASGVTAFSLGAPVWGLLAGGLMLGLRRIGP